MKVRYAKEYNSCGFGVYAIYAIFKIYEDGTFKKFFPLHPPYKSVKRPWSYTWKPIPNHDGDWYNEEITEAEAFLEMV